MLLVSELISTAIMLQSIEDAFRSLSTKALKAGER